MLLLAIMLSSVEGHLTSVLPSELLVTVVESAASEGADWLHGVMCSHYLLTCPSADLCFGSEDEEGYMPAVIHRALTGTRLSCQWL